MGPKPANCDVNVHLDRAPLRPVRQTFSPILEELPWKIGSNTMSALDYPGRSTARANELRTIGDCLRTFGAEGAPRAIVAGVTIALAVRVLVGGFGLFDVATIALSVLVVGFVEWAIHVHWLHAPTESRRMRIVRSGVSHRQHHADPQSVGFLLLTGPDAIGYMVVLLAWHATWPLAFAWIVGAPLFATYLTALTTSYVLLAYYEWIHLLIHTNYRPKTAYFQRRAQHHRLHHYRNENYWMGVTNTFGDRSFDTFPADKSDVPLSDTTRTLQSS